MCVCRDWSMDVALKMSACVCVCVWMERREVWVGSKRCLCIYRERSVVAERKRVNGIERRGMWKKKGV